MPNKFLWHDAKIEKPDNNDVYIVLTSNGYVAIAQWKGSYWYELASDETYNAVDWWSDFKLPHGWNISDDYYEG